MSSAKPSCFTVFACPPARPSRSKTWTSCTCERTYAAPSPATPLPTTAIRIPLFYTYIGRYLYTPRACHRSPPHEPDQPDRHARRRHRPAARDPRRDGTPLGRRVPLVRPRSFHRLLRRVRVRDDDRLPPLLHAPRLRDEQAGRGDARDPRLHDDAGPAHAMGHRPPQAPRLLGPARRPALAARRASGGSARRRARLRPRARRLALLKPRHGAGPRVRDAISTRTSSSAASTGCISSG